MKAPVDETTEREDLKELSALCRAGKLFAVQDWIESGRPYFTIEPRRRARSAFQVALDTGFHSLVEVFLKAGLPQDQRDEALSTAVFDRRVDLARLLVSYGADRHAVTVEDVFDSRCPELIRWMIDLGLDLEARWPLARAFENRQREILGIYMDLRDKVPSARRQVAMALRKHSRDGNLKWISLLLWAGADPRLPVPLRDERDPGKESEEDIGTALEDAVTYGHFEAVRKFKVDPVRDNIDALLCLCWLIPTPAIIEMLLALGANPNSRVQDRTPMEATVGALSFSLDSTLGYSSWNNNRREQALASIELLSRHGACWNPIDRDQFSSFRRALGRAEQAGAIRSLKRIVNAGALEPDVFHELMRTPKMKALLEYGFCGDTAALKRYAGFSDKKSRPTERR